MGEGPVVACHHCATLHERTPLEPGALAKCTRCGYVLYRFSAVPVSGWLAMVTGALVIFAIANYFPVAILNMQGQTVKASFPGALWLTWIQGHEVLAIMTGLFGFWLPFSQLTVLLWALMSIRSGRLPGDFRYGMRFLHMLAPWSNMIPVLMLGMLVAMVKFAGLATLAPGPGLWAFALLAFLLTGLSRVTAERLWRYAEDAGVVLVSRPDLSDSRLVASCGACGFVQNLLPDQDACACSRCRAPIHTRKPNETSRVWALLIAASIIYIPANILPVMHVRTAAGDGAHTILGGVLELWYLGSWDLALIVFVASVVVPMTKLLALMVLMLNRRWRGPRIQRQRTRLYELVEFIGQWSMLDVFVVVVMSAMANFPGISQVIAGPGAASFGLVVILTMLAAMSYDPRHGWDRQTEKQRSRAKYWRRDSSGQAASGTTQS
ncbi:paraquat-inducible membrane protein A [Pollutimonas nitritireducens]|uniref:Paraquat-inducible membrane protein A n=1 Tax=Pollutimonas nitritireducens TaxID=2045209 RepID=A0A2N4UEV4_9BURK|nr:paraquat-inducible protein A [Pollutimonas nitritireducens]PLC53552.1 paraquat-inducible membrane protein A [Pollutimonas nitritireducens]